MMRKIIEVYKFFGNSVFFMKKNVFFSNFRFYTSNLLKYFAYLQFWYQIQDPASKEWSALAKAAWTTAKSLHRHPCALAQGWSETGRKACTRAPSGRINWQIRAHLGFRFPSNHPPLYQESIEQSYFLRFAPSQSELLSR